MKLRFHLIDRNLKRAAGRWRWLRLLQHTATVGAALCAVLLLIGAGILSGWLDDKSLVTALIILVSAGAALVWFVLALTVAAGSPDRGWLADLLEHGQPRLLDRLNTLVFLEKGRKPAQPDFHRRIAAQTQELLEEKKPDVPIPAVRPLMHTAVFLVLLAGTLFIFQRFDPWQKLLAAAEAKKVIPTQEESPLELAPPVGNLVEEVKAWGEVRITEPGRDMRVTKVDVVPLQIEAAASEALQQVGWSTTINGTGEQPQDLPLPADPRYAVYQPTLYLDELRLSDWDVLTYYAKAETTRTNAFASEVYFLEVRPFREDILKLPGGENGEAAQCLNQLTSLIERQQHIIRQTHQHAQRPPETAKLEEQDRAKLADAEADLRDSVNHLYAGMAATMENRPIGEALDQLAKAEKSLDLAAGALRLNTMTEAQNKERSGLAELVAARKMFQKAVSDNPEAFDGENKEEPPVTAEQAKQLKQIAEFRDEAKAAQEFIQKALEKQQDITTRAATNSSPAYPQLAEEQKQLQQSVSDFQEQHPQLFRGLEQESAAAQGAMKKAGQQLEKRSYTARRETQQAVDALESLGDALQSQTADQQLADAYKLKEMLDRQIATLAKTEQAPESVPNEQLQQTVADAQDTLDQLQSMAQQEPTAANFAPPLREALSDPNKAALDAQLQQVAQAQAPGDRQQAAGEAREGLSKVRDAFQQSLPQAMQMARQAKPLGSAPEDSLGLGMDQLQSLLQQLESNRDLPPEDLNKLARETLFHLQSGMETQFGSNERGQQLLALMEKELKQKGDQPLDVANLKNLLKQLQHFSTEVADLPAEEEKKAEMTNIDPTRLPPAYRGRVEKYFQKLSEK